MPDKIFLNLHITSSNTLKIFEKNEILEGKVILEAIVSFPLSLAHISTLNISVFDGIKTCPYGPTWSFQT